ncbi:MAG: TauD/TfdA family dioxygenase [Pseudomonadota bacterium]
MNARGKPESSQSRGDVMQTAIQCQKPLPSIEHRSRSTGIVAQEIVETLRARPHFVVLSDIAATEDPSVVRKLVQAIASLPAGRPALQLARSPRITCDRVEFDPLATLVEAERTNYSRTRKAMALHTDGSFAQTPPDLVAFQMVRCAAKGGESVIVSIEDVIAGLDEATRATLSQPMFPFSARRHSVLWRTQGHYNIRCYKNQIDVSSERKQPLEPAASLAIAALDAALADPNRQYRIRLEPGEILFLHNTRALHGRTAFDADCSRLMLRVRAHASCLV